MEFFREAATDQYRALLRKAWMPRTGSRANQKALTATLIDSRDFLDARLRQKAASLIPEGTRIAFTGGTDADHRAVWVRSEERRVGKEGVSTVRSLWWRPHSKKKKET